MKNWFHSIALAAMLSAGAVTGALAQAKADPAAAAKSAPAPAAKGDPAVAGKDLLAKSGCLACHAVDKKLVGPAHLDVANKYRNDKGAESKLVAHVLNGGAGVWGQIPMPPHKHIPEADIRAMVRYVLSLK
ncbi:MAG: c-type cytochrome [Proteobacteria bacterium]|nr:c-type cytochrome [Burkholderiales bacterium]